MKLNLGCGQNRIKGYVNVDREPAAMPDLVMDMEQFPWPFDDDSVDEVRAVHVLEHVGAAPHVFIGVMQEIYRVCRAGATVFVIVPHPRHDDFVSDPTHVRPITPMTLSLFSKRNCEQWKREGAANTPLALYADVDFELREWKVSIDAKYSGRPDLADLIENWNNVATEYHFWLEVIK